MNETDSYDFANQLIDENHLTIDEINKIDTAMRREWCLHLTYLTLARELDQYQWENPVKKPFETELIYKIKATFKPGPTIAEGFGADDEATIFVKQEYYCLGLQEHFKSRQKKLYKYFKNVFNT